MTGDRGPVRFGGMAGHGAVNEKHSNLAAKDKQGRRVAAAADDMSPYRCP